MRKKKRQIVIDISTKNQSNLAMATKSSITESDITQDNNVLSTENNSLSKDNTKTRGVSIMESQYVLSLNFNYIVIYFSTRLKINYSIYILANTKYH